MMESFLTTEGLIALATLSAMEIVLGIDNIVFIAILVGKLPLEQRKRIRSIGIFLALFMRLALLFSISWIMGLTEPFIEIFGKGFSGRDFILLGGGLFLMAKSTHEIHSKIELGDHALPPGIDASKARRSLGLMLAQIVLLDIVFSLDSVITAVGMANDIPIMTAAMVIAMIVMLISSGAIGDFVEKNPTIKILALSFLLLIGVMLTAEGMGSHINKGYIYFAMAFSLGIELLNMRYRKKSARTAKAH